LCIDGLACKQRMHIGSGAITLKNKS
jgi:hypothetical protein